MTDSYLEAVKMAVAAEQVKQERLSKIDFVAGNRILTEKYEEPRYIWNGILPDSGLAIVAASKATGKTMLLLQLADAVSKGRPFLGIETETTKTLFLELELSQRRTAQRLAKMGIVPDKNLDFVFKWPATGNDSLQLLADAIDANSYGLVVVDVMQMLWPLDADTNSYQDTYSVLAPLRQMANDLGVMILLVTHRRKAETADYVDSVVGSVGIAANCDVVMTLQRNRGEDSAILLVAGNDIESQKLVLDFCIEPLGFVRSDASPNEIEQTPERRKILEFMRTNGNQARTSEIARSLGIDDSTASRLVNKLVHEGLATRTQYGTYALK